MNRNKIIKSATPSHIFSVIHSDVDLTVAEEIEVRYVQDKELVFSKFLSNGDIEVPTKTTMVVDLTEEDTNSLDATLKVYIRPVLTLQNGRRIPSANTICATVEDL